MDVQRKDHPDPKTPPKKNSPQQLQTHNVPTNVVEITNGINKREDLLFAKKLQTVLWGIEKMLPWKTGKWKWLQAEKA